MAVIRDRTSAAARGCWLPLLLFGALICGSLPFYERLSRSRPSLAGLPAAGHCRAAVNQPCHVSAGVGHVTVVAALGYYWQVAIPVGFLLTGLVLGELVLLVPLLVGQSSSLTLLRLMRDTHQAGPLAIIAALLWVLAWTERSPALAVIAAIYLVAALVVSHYTNGGLAGGTTGAADLSLTALRLLGLLPALILLAAGSGTWLTQRRQLRSHRVAAPA